MSAQLVGGQSTPYTPTGVHDFSANAEGNAENQLRIGSRRIADEYAAFIATLARTFGAGRPAATVS